MEKVEFRLWLLLVADVLSLWDVDRLVGCLRWVSSRNGTAQSSYSDELCGADVS
jgi:hypothetical protein